jgi:hypothetical protein
MMTYSPSAGHINQALTNLVVKHPTTQNFIADRICNVVPVEKESDKYYKIRDSHLIDQSDRTLKAAGAQAKEVAISWTEDSYSCDQHGLEATLPDRSRDNADSQLGIELETVALPREGVLLAKEIRAAAILFSTTHMTNTTGTGARWDDATAANIKAFSEIIDSCLKVQKFGSVTPDHMAIGADTWAALSKYIISQSGPTAAVQVQGLRELLQQNPRAIPPEFCGLTLLVGSASYSTALRAEDVSRAASGGNLTFVWPDNCLIFHKGTSGKKTVQTAARFVKRDHYPRVEQGRFADSRQSNWYLYSEVESGAKVIAPSCAYLLTDTLT